MTRHARLAVAATALGLLAMACGGGGAAECAPDAAAAAATASAEVLPGASALAPATAPGRLARDVAVDLFEKRFAAVHARFTPSLKESVPEARLGEILAGVVGAHGPAVALLDAWATEVPEGEHVTLPAAAALIRMKDEVRFRLLLVLTPDQAITGFWFRPI